MLHGRTASENSGVKPISYEEGYIAGAEDFAKTLNQILLGHTKNEFLAVEIGRLIDITLAIHTGGKLDGASGEAMTEAMAEVIVALADCGFNKCDVARKLFLHRNAVDYRIQRIREKTGKDPMNFYDLCDLLPAAKAICKG